MNALHRHAARASKAPPQCHRDEPTRQEPVAIRQTLMEQLKSSRRHTNTRADLIRMPRRGRLEDVESVGHAVCPLLEALQHLAGNSTVLGHTADSEQHGRQRAKKQHTSSETPIGRNTGRLSDSGRHRVADWNVFRLLIPESRQHNDLRGGPAFSVPTTWRSTSWSLGLNLQGVMLAVKVTDSWVFPRQPSRKYHGRWPVFELQDLHGRTKNAHLRGLRKCSEETSCPRRDLWRRFAKDCPFTHCAVISNLHKRISEERDILTIE